MKTYMLNIFADIDECALGLHQCHSNSKCVNMPGWYYCECREGYRTRVTDLSFGHNVVCQGLYIDTLYYTIQFSFSS